jgi:prepilin signal peptidase PulO-like enzyme (type II secretory pathway)
VNIHFIVLAALRILLGGLLGLIGASFSGHLGWQAADRLPGESRWPHCAFCLRAYPFSETLPLLGWLRRKDPLSFPCPCSERRNLWVQPAIEVMGCLLGIAAAAIVPWSAALVPLILGLSLLPVIGLIDLHFGIIPNELNLLMALTGFLWLLCGGGEIYMGLMLAAFLLGVGLFLALAYSRWRGREMLGLGDVKFFAAAGLWLRPDLAPWFFAIAGLIGVVTSFLWRRAGGGKELPFAPALCFALAICIFYRLVMA